MPGDVESHGRAAWGKRIDNANTGSSRVIPNEQSARTVDRERDGIHQRSPLENYLSTRSRHIAVAIAGELNDPSIARVAAGRSIADEQISIGVQGESLRSLQACRGSQLRC